MFALNNSVRAKRSPHRLFSAQSHEAISDLLVIELPSEIIKELNAESTRLKSE